MVGMAKWLVDARRGKNKHSSMVDTALSTFSVFFPQCPSVRNQRKEASVRSKGQSLFRFELSLPTTIFARCPIPLSQANSMVCLMRLNSSPWTPRGIFSGSL
jgi:hypothetical protein